ncbi:MAG: hypothetical protein RIB98_05475 [Acidimicrobiales bacterium]
MARRLIAVVFAVVTFASCAEPAPPTLEAGSLEASLPAAVWPDDPALVTDVDCPGLDVEVVAQAVACTAMLDGASVTVDVAVDEAIEGQAATTATVRETLFVVAEAADQLAARLATDLGIEPPTVACDRAVVIAEAGTELACVARRDADPIDFVVRLLDDTGGWTLN